MDPLLPAIEIETAAAPLFSVIWMHGLGADGSDFEPVVPELGLDDGPGVRFIFPHAPAIPVTCNGGYVMPAWYDIRGTALVRDEDRAGIEASAMAIEALIANEIKRGVAPGAIVLAGFSQGSAMALHTGLRHPAPLAAVIALSGYLPLADAFAAQRSAANQSTPIFMAHGDDDEVVPLGRATTSKQVLSELGYQIQWHRYAMGHSVHPQEVMDIAEFLRAVLGCGQGAPKS